MIADSPSHIGQLHSIIINIDEWDCFIIKYFSSVSNINIHIESLDLLISQRSLAHTSGPRSKLFSNRLDLFSSLTSNKANNTIQTLQLQTVFQSGYFITSIVQQRTEKQVD